MSNLNEQQFGEYRGGHRSPGPDPDFPQNSMHDFSTTLPDYPYNDVHKAIHWYGSPSSPQQSHEAHRAVVSARGNPEALVPVYRAMPKDSGDINPGDWVTPSPSYARSHRESNGQDSWRIAHRVVRAGDLYTEGDIHEWGWHPESKNHDDHP